VILGITLGAKKLEQAFSPVAFVLAHKLAHIYGAVSFYDPKLGKYIICIRHNPTYKLGNLVD
jgi:CRISPR-associated protein Csx3